MLSSRSSSSYITMFHEHAHKLVIWKAGLYFLVEIMIRFTVWSTKASLTQNVAIITMGLLLFFEITVCLFFQNFMLFRGLKFSDPKPLLS